MILWRWQINPFKNKKVKLFFTLLRFENKSPEDLQPFCVKIMYSIYMILFFCNAYNNFNNSSQVRFQLQAYLSVYTSLDSRELNILFNYNTCDVPHLRRAFQQIIQNKTEITSG